MICVITKNGVAMNDKKVLLYSILCILVSYLCIDAQQTEIDPKWMPVCYLTQAEIEDGYIIQVEIVNEFIMVSTKYCYVVFVYNGTWILVHPLQTVVVSPTNIISVQYAKIKIGTKHPYQKNISEQTAK